MDVVEKGVCGGDWDDWREEKTAVKMQYMREEQIEEDYRRISTDFRPTRAT